MSEETTTLIVWNIFFWFCVYIIGRTNYEGWWE